MPGIRQLNMQLMDSLMVRDFIHSTCALSKSNLKGLETRKIYIETVAPGSRTLEPIVAILWETKSHVPRQVVPVTMLLYLLLLCLRRWDT